MAKRKRHVATPVYRLLEPLRTRCEECGGPLWIAYHNTRTVATLDSGEKILVRTIGPSRNVGVRD